MHMAIDGNELHGVVDRAGWSPRRPELRYMELLVGVFNRVVEQLHTQDAAMSSSTTPTTKTMRPSESDGKS
jgi:hypothetical protein